MADGLFGFQRLFFGAQEVPGRLGLLDVQVSLSMTRIFSVDTSTCARSLRVAERQRRIGETGISSFAGPHNDPRPRTCGDVVYVAVDDARRRGEGLYDDNQDQRQTVLNSLTTPHASTGERHGSSVWECPNGSAASGPTNHRGVLGEPAAGRWLRSSAFFVIALAPAATVRAQEGPLEINAILEMTGSAALLGAHEAQTLSVVERLVNSSGGIGGRPITFVIHDGDAGIPQNDVQLMNALLSEEGQCGDRAVAGIVVRGGSPAVDHRAGRSTIAFRPGLELAGRFVHVHRERRIG